MKFFTNKVDMIGYMVRKLLISDCNKLKNALLNCKDYQSQDIIKQREGMSSKNPILAQINKAISQAKKQGGTQLDLTEIKIVNFTPEICQVIEKLTKLEILFLTGCGLKTLEGFPKGKFVAIDLSKNEYTIYLFRLNDESKLDVLAKYPTLTQILLNDNQIKKFETVLQLSTLPKLIEVDFAGNKVTQNQKYRESIFQKFQIIEIVDQKDKEGKEVIEQNQEEDYDADEQNEDDDDDDDDEFDEEEEDDEFDEEDYEDEEESEPKKKKGANSKKK